MVLTCTLPDDPDGREWRVERRQPAGEFALVLRSALGRVVSAELPLPSPRVMHERGRFALSAASANGGAAVTIRAGVGGTLLDVFVNYELEVNVHRDLRPDVESMNTHGPRPDARCILAPDGAR